MLISKLLKSGACSITIVLFIVLATYPSLLLAQIEVTRLNNNQSIIDRSMPATESNINGPSMVRVPDWVPVKQRADSSAVYYLYFASHWGTHIKMAWSEHIEGPYTMYNTGKGVIHVDTYTETANLSINQHIASPDVLIDDANQRFIMYFHAGIPTWNGDTIEVQQTVVACSDYGLNFNQGLENVIISPFYARVFEFNSNLYALTKTGLYKARNFYYPWEHYENFSNANPELWRRVSRPFHHVANTVRHFAVLREADTLHLMFTRYPGSPEHIEYSKIILSNNEWAWKLSEPEDILYPEYEWEGVNHPIEESIAGYSSKVNELRDPDLFLDEDGQVYLLYTGSGEDAIGIARVDGLLSSNQVTDPNRCYCSSTIKIFPNPCMDENINISGFTKNSIIEVFSLSGEKIFLLEVEESKTIQIDTGGMQKGIVLISIQNGIDKCWYRVVIQ